MILSMENDIFMDNNAEHKWRLIWVHNACNVLFVYFGEGHMLVLLL